MKIYHVTLAGVTVCDVKGHHFGVTKDEVHESFAFIYMHTCILSSHASTHFSIT